MLFLFQSPPEKCSVHFDLLYVYFLPLFLARCGSCGMSTHLFVEESCKADQIAHFLKHETAVYQFSLSSLQCAHTEVQQRTHKTGSFNTVERMCLSHTVGYSNKACLRSFIQYVQRQKGESSLGDTSSSEVVLCAIFWPYRDNLVASHVQRTEAWL